MRETAEVVAAARRMIRAVGNRIAEEDVEQLRYLEILEAAIDLARSDAIEGLRRSGMTDVQIGEQMGMTRQAVQQRWPRRVRVVGAGARQTLTYGDLSHSASEVIE